MGLCKLCQQFDIRLLLLASAAQEIQTRQFTGINNTQFNNVDHYRSIVGANDYHQPIPYFYPHFKTIIELKACSEEGCPLCSLFWSTWVGELTKSDFTEEWLSETFQGEIYIGSSGWTNSRQGLPYVTLTQKTPTGQTRILCTFDAFAKREDVPHDEAPLLGRAVYSEPASKECLAVAKEWLHTCLNEHKMCKSSASYNRTLPTRVIEVGNENCNPKLLSTNSKLGIYIALSYCWGGESTFVLNVKTMRDLQEGIPLVDYPTTLRDAIIITRSLGVQYLWIDALCIQQDSAEDWAKEAAKMREVYSGAVLTIAAANSPTTRSGIFSSRKPTSARVPIEWKASPDSQKAKSHVYLRPGSELWDHSLQLSPLMGRGWTLQEGLLAPRTLSYGAQQMIWECPQYQIDEGGRITQASEDYRAKGFIQRLIQSEREIIPKKPPERFLSRLTLRSPPTSDGWWKAYSIAHPLEKWYDIFREFTGRSLTKEYDVLPALSGLARVFQTVVKSEYHAGMWQEDHIYSLLWSRSPRYPSDGSSRFDPSRPSEYLAPSWSWASILGKQASIIFPSKTRDLLCQRGFDGAKMISMTTVPKAADQFGQVVAGELKLRARFSRLEFVPPAYSIEMQWPVDDDPISPEKRSQSAWQNHVYQNLLIVDEMVYEFYQQHIPHPNQHFAVIEIVPWVGSPGSGVPGIDCLIIESTGRKEDEYRRVGKLKLRKEVVPDREDVSEEAYRAILLENEAYEELTRGGKTKWKKRVVTLV